MKTLRLSAHSAALHSLTEAYFTAHGYQIEYVLSRDPLGDADAWLVPLSQLSTELSAYPKNYTIAAALPRFAPEYHLFIQKTKYNAENMLGLPLNAVIKVQNALAAAHILDYSNNYIIIYNEDIEYDAFLGNVFDIPRFDTASFVIRTLNTAEAPPEAGQGVAVLVCKTEDILLRLELRALHHAPTAACSNVERRALQLLGYKEYNEIFGAYCRTDADHNYHVHFALATNTGLQTARLAHTGRIALAEAVVKKTLSFL